MRWPWVILVWPIRSLQSTTSSLLLSRFDVVHSEGVFLIVLSLLSFGSIFRHHVSNCVFTACLARLARSVWIG